jgi:hypothetical protein
MSFVLGNRLGIESATRGSVWTQTNDGKHLPI